MLEFSAFRRPLVTLALLSSAFAVSASPASARSHHGTYRYLHARYAYRYAPRRFAQPQFAQPQFFGQSANSQVASYPRVVYRARMERRHVEQSVALSRLRKFANTQASATPYEPGGGMVTSGNSSSLVMEARHYLGTNPTSRGSLWCARFMNMVLQQTGHQGTGSDMASSFASYGIAFPAPRSAPSPLWAVAAAAMSASSPASTPRAIRS